MIRPSNAKVQGKVAGKMDWCQDITGVCLSTLHRRWWVWEEGGWNGGVCYGLLEWDGRSNDLLCIT